jgi:hypothetical protein
MQHPKKDNYKLQLQKPFFYPPSLKSMMAALMTNHSLYCAHCVLSSCESWVHEQLYSLVLPTGKYSASATVLRRASASASAEPCAEILRMRKTWLAGLNDLQATLPARIDAYFTKKVRKKRHNFFGFFKTNNSVM